MMTSIHPPEFEMIALGDLLANPHRRISEYPIQASRVAMIRASIESSGFWNNIEARPADDGKYEIAYGHHRLAALGKMWPGAEHLGNGGLLKRGAKIPIMVVEMDDGAMIRRMAAENSHRHDGEGMDFWTDMETVAAVIDAYGRGLIELGEVPTQRPDLLSVTGDRKYSSSMISQFLGGEVGGWKKTKVKDCHQALTCVERGLAKAEDFQGIGVRSARTLASGLFASERDALAIKAKAKEDRERAVEAAKRASAEREEARAAKAQAEEDRRMAEELEREAAAEARAARDERDRKAAAVRKSEAARRKRLAAEAEANAEERQAQAAREEESAKFNLEKANRKKERAKKAGTVAKREQKKLAKQAQSGASGQDMAKAKAESLGKIAAAAEHEKEDLRYRTFSESVSSKADVLKRYFNGNYDELGSIRDALDSGVDFRQEGAWDGIHDLHKYANATITMLEKLVASIEDHGPSRSSQPEQRTARLLNE